MLLLNLNLPFYGVLGITKIAVLSVGHDKLYRVADGVDVQ